MPERERGLTRRRTVPENRVAMLTFDVECPVTFADDVAPEARALFRKAIGGSPGWFTALPVVRWPGPREALVLFVLREPEGAAEDAICEKALAEVRGWLATAGLASESGPAPDIGCTAILRG
jgi:hypothetical protein